MRTVPYTLSAAALLAAVCTWQPAAAQAPVAEAVDTAAEPLAATSATAPEGRSLSLQQLDGRASIDLRGTEGLYSWRFGLRLDETVTRATLKLRYTASPSLLPELSHLRVRLNGELIATLPLPREEAGKEQLREVRLDPGYFSDYNELLVQLVGHYTTDCEDPQHSSLWATVSGKSTLELALSRLAPAPDLALLPAPFFDEHDPRPLTLPFVMGSTRTAQVLAAAGTVASWFGALADYRGARFPVLLNRLPEDSHAVVFASSELRVDGLDLPAVTQPTLSVAPHPHRPDRRLLVLQGRDAAQLKTAADALVLGQAVLTGPRSSIAALSPVPRRPANDAPRWIRTDRPVELGELVEDPARLQVDGHAPAPVTVRFRAAPDLFAWNSAGIPLNLIYRYTPPREDDNSMLTVSMNDRIVRSFRLRRPAEGAAIELPFANDDARAERRLRIPPFQLGADNQLRFQFAVDHHRAGPCRDSGLDPVRSAIDPASTIDFRGVPHYAELPDLAKFANAGYPFTRYADLAETAVVLPSEETPTDVETALALLGRLGRMTGAPGTAAVWVRAADVESVEDRDLLIVGGGKGSSMPEEWNRSLPAVIQRMGAQLTPLRRAGAYASQLWSNAGSAGDQGDPGRNEAAWRLAVESQGEIAALVGFESPLESGRSAVALLASSRKMQGSVLDALDDTAKVQRFRGHTVIVRDEAVEPYGGGPRYSVGHLPPGTRARLLLSRHPLLAVVFAVIAVIIIGFWMNWSLRRLAARRVRGE